MLQQRKYYAVWWSFDKQHNIVATGIRIMFILIAIYLQCTCPTICTLLLSLSFVQHLQILWHLIFSLWPLSYTSSTSNWHPWHHVLLSHAQVLICSSCLSYHSTSMFLHFYDKAGETIIAYTCSEGRTERDGRKMER